MALIRCSACGQIVSDKAPFCPHCGKAVQAGSSPQGVPRQPAVLSPSKPDPTGNAIAGSLILITALGILAFVALLVAGWWVYNNVINRPVVDVMCTDVDTAAVVDYVEEYPAVVETVAVAAPTQ